MLRVCARIHVYIELFDMNVPERIKTRGKHTELTGSAGKRSRTS